MNFDPFGKYFLFDIFVGKHLVLHFSGAVMIVKYGELPKRIGPTVTIGHFITDGLMWYLNIKPN